MVRCNRLTRHELGAQEWWGLAWSDNATIFASSHLPGTNAIWAKAIADR